VNSVYGRRLGRYWLLVVGTKVIVYQSVLVLSGSTGIVNSAFSLVLCWEALESHGPPSSPVMLIGVTP
jgi:hypothetical protein